MNDFSPTTKTGCSHEELLDELLSIATDAGRLGAAFYAAQKEHEEAPAGHRKACAGRRLRDARKAWEAAEQALHKCRARFLASTGEAR